MKHSFDRGSTPLEMVVSIALLLMPIGPIAMLAAQLNDEMAAESIARNALRLAILHNPTEPQDLIGVAVSQLADNWGREVSSFEIVCTKDCELISLRVQVGSASATQTMGLEP